MNTKSNVPDEQTNDPKGKEEWESPTWEIYGAKLWNVANESKTFVSLMTIFVLVLLNLFNLDILTGEFWYHLVLLSPLGFALWYFDYPLNLRGILWLILIIVVGYYSINHDAENLIVPLLLILFLYFGFTLGIWGFVYYHFLTKEPWSTTKNFWKLVMTNDDSTSGNFWQCFPQIFTPVTMFMVLEKDVSNGEIASFIMVSLLLIPLSYVIHKNWHKGMRTYDHPQPKPFVRTKAGKMIVVVIDGCRRDRIRDPGIPTPFLDSLASGGTEYTHVRTMYPARTSVCFSSMMTGKLPHEHGISSNFVTRPVKGDTVFDILEKQGKKGVLIGIAHFDDIAHENWNVRSVCSFMKNEEADKVIFEVTRKTIEEMDPDLVVTQLIAVDQTGHMRGSVGSDYAEALTRVDQDIKEFSNWLERRGFFEDGVIIVMADHGQGRGIGGHGYWGDGEIIVPMIIHGKGVPRGEVNDEERSIMDLAPTIVEVLI